MTRARDLFFTPAAVVPRIGPLRGILNELCDNRALATDRDRLVPGWLGL